MGTTADKLAYLQGAKEAIREAIESLGGTVPDGLPFRQYASRGSLLEFDSLDALRQLLVDHGWTWLTAVCTMLFSLMHWPCSTTCLTIGKETKSAKWTLLSIAIPTGIGMAVCFLVASAARLLGLA